MKLFVFAGSILLASCASQTEKPIEKTAPSSNSFAGKTAIVYTTADSTSDRITATDTLRFTDFAQPLETDACVFIDPAHTYQTMLGIGGALTDASAETYAKLPADR